MIRKKIAGSAFDPVTVRAMVDAYDAVRVELKLPGGDSPNNEQIAEKIVQLAHGGERDPQVMAKRALMMLGAH